MSKSNVKSLNALSVKLGKDSDAFNKVGALKNIYAALSGKESKGITVSDVIDEITTVAEKPTTQEVVWVEGTVSNEVTSVNIPNGITSIGESGCRNLVNLKTITLPNTVKSIGNNAFRNCENLTEIVVPEGATSIGNYGFSWCKKLTSVTLPVSTSSFGEEAFSNCTLIGNIYYEGTEEQWKAITKGKSWNYSMGSDVEGGTVITYNYTG